MSENLEFRLKTGKIAAKVWGPPDGRPVLALHGWLDNANSFDLVAQKLHGLRVIAPDFPGHGLSDPLPPGAQYHFIDSIPVVAEIVASLGWSRFSVIGHSMGGAIGCLLAAILPQQVEKLFLIDAIGPMSESPEGNVGRLRQYVERWLRRKGNSRRTYATRDEMVAARQKVAALGDEGARRLVERGSVAVEGGFQWSSDPRLTLPSSLRMTEAQVLAFLKQIACPTYLLWASEGMPGRLPYIADQLKERARAVPNLIEHSLDGGHHLHLDHPDEVARRILTFL